MLIPLTFHFRPQPTQKFNTPHNQVPAAVDTGLWYLLLQFPYHLRNIHQHTPAAQHCKIRPVPQCHNRLTRILAVQPVMHPTTDLTRPRKCDDQNMVSLYSLVT